MNHHKEDEINQTKSSKESACIDERTQRETNKMIKLIQQAKQMKKLGPNVDMTPASVTKFKSGGGQSYCVKLNQKSESLNRHKLQGAIG